MNLEIYHAMQQAIETGESYQMLLDPPPADPRIAHPLRVCSKSPMLWSVSVVACTETDPGTSPRSADGASTESC